MGFLDIFIKRRGGDEAEMSFLDHLEELRWHIVRSLIAITAVGIVIFIKTTYIFDNILLAPTHPDFWTFRKMCALGNAIHMSNLCMGDFSLTIQNIDMSGQFMISLTNAFSLGLVIAFPYVLWEAWRFVKPALHEEERRQATGVVIAGSMLFYVGITFGYFFISPFTVYFLGSYQVSETIPNVVNLESYLGTVTGLCFACGLVFEFPLVMYFLAKIGLATHEFLNQYRKVAVVIILLIAAVITPSPDWVSQSLVAIPLYGLFEVGMVISKRVTNRRRRLAVEKEAEAIKESIS